MRLTELEPSWVKYKNWLGVGVQFLCPRCRGCTIAILFLNPAGGGPSVPNDDNVVGNNGGYRWARSGLSFDELTATPSVDASIIKRENYKSDEAFQRANRPCTEGGSRHWHGYITHGEVT